MKIVVCAKTVPGYIIDPQISETKDRIIYKAGTIITNESDEYALEEAVALKKKFGGGEVTVLTAGPFLSVKALHTGLAKDADKAARIDTDRAEGGYIAKALAEAIKRLGYDLILTGIESSDSLSAQVGIMVAEMLGLPFAYAVTEVERGEKEGTLKVTKEIGAGVKLVEEITLPALLCMQTGTTPLSYVTLRKLVQARSKPTQTFTISNLGLDEEFKQPSASKIVGILSPQMTSKAEIITGKPPEIASVLIKKVREVL